MATLSSWTTVDVGGGTDTYKFGIAADGRVMLGGNDASIFFSSDYGRTWEDRSPANLTTDVTYHAPDWRGGTSWVAAGNLHSTHWDDNDAQSVRWREDSPPRDIHDQFRHTLYLTDAGSDGLVLVVGSRGADSDTVQSWTTKDAGGSWEGAGLDDINNHYRDHSWPNGPSEIATDGQVVVVPVTWREDVDDDIDDWDRLDVRTYDIDMSVSDGLTNRTTARLQKQEDDPDLNRYKKGDQCCRWIEETQEFVLGTGLGKIYRSTDGRSWSLAADYLPSGDWSGYSHYPISGIDAARDVNGDLLYVALIDGDVYTGSSLGSLTNQQVSVGGTWQLSYVGDSQWIISLYSSSSIMTANFVVPRTVSGGLPAGGNATTQTGSMTASQAVGLTGTVASADGTGVAGDMSGAVSTGVDATTAGASYESFDGSVSLGVGLTPGTAAGSATGSDADVLARRQMVLDATVGEYYARGRLAHIPPVLPAGVAAASASGHTASLSYGINLPADLAGAAADGREATMATGQAGLFDAEPANADAGALDAEAQAQQQRYVGATVADAPAAGLDAGVQIPTGVGATLASGSSSATDGTVSASQAVTLEATPGSAPAGGVDGSVQAQQTVDLPATTADGLASALDGSVGFGTATTATLAAGSSDTLAASVATGATLGANIVSASGSGVDASYRIGIDLTADMADRIAALAYPATLGTGASVDGGTPANAAATGVDGGLSYGDTLSATTADASAEGLPDSSFVAGLVVDASVATGTASAPDASYTAGVTLDTSVAESVATGLAGLMPNSPWRDLSTTVAGANAVGVDAGLHALGPVRIEVGGQMLSVAYIRFRGESYRVLEARVDGETVAKAYT